MKLKMLQGEFETEELAELAAGRIRRSVHGIRRADIRTSRGHVPKGDRKYTLLPANLRMQNYATAVMVSEMADTAAPEPMQRRTARLTIICEEDAADRASAILQSFGALNLQFR